MFLRFLRNALWGTPLSVDNTSAQPAIDWQRLIADYSRHAMLGVVADALSSFDDGAIVRQQPQLHRQMLQHTAALLQTHHKITSTTYELFAALQQQGMHPILLKGDVYAALYPQRCIRACGDVDIYVGTEEYDKAKELLDAMNRQLGDTAAIAASNDVQGHEYHSTYRGIVIELHARAGWAGNRFRKKNFDGWCNRWLVYPHCQPGTIPYPDPQFDVLYVFNHMCQHLSNGGLGLRQFCDWAVLLHHYHGKIDLAQLRRDLRRIGIYKAWQTLGGIAVYQIGLPEAEFPFFSARRAKRSQGWILDELMSGANFQTGKRPHRQLPHGPRRTWLSFLHLMRLTRTANIISTSTAVAAFLENLGHRVHGTIGRIWQH